MSEEAYLLRIRTFRLEKPSFKDKICALVEARLSYMTQDHKFGRFLGKETRETLLAELRIF